MRATLAIAVPAVSASGVHQQHADGTVGRMPREQGRSPATGDSQEPLAKYRRMRDFSRTPEPSGAPPAGLEGGDRVFVVQRHRATARHYDFRLEVDGVLASWAVPKGPSLDPEVRRLAIHVEDHPMEYLHFEGVIPAKEYGGGDVIVWDTGTWEPGNNEDPATAIRAGTLHVIVHGEKLRGEFMLVRTARQEGDKEQWLLFHKHDEHTVEGWDAEDFPRSVLSGRTNEEVLADPDQLWHSDRPAGQAAESLRVAVPDPLTEDELSALRDLGSSGTWEVFGQQLRLTNLDKVLFPARQGDEPVTKREFIEYAGRIAPVLLPYLAGRAVNLHRHPDGAQAKGFWHKEVPDHAPEWLPRWDNPDAGPGETQTYLVVDEAAALVWAANYGALEWHPWTSPTTAPDCPSYVMFDIDPGEGTTWEEALDLARLHRTAFEALHLRAYPKVTGRRGLQVWVPIRRGPSFADTRAWAEKVSRSIGAMVPDLVSWRWEVKSRKGLARLDYTQNAVNKTLVAPYSPRPSAGAPVSVPITWDELDDPELRPDRWTVRTVLDRLDEVGDPFQGVLHHDQTLPRVR
ncbi:non-homologous end-joining DNA ligase [Ornithinimicrobium cryptoxanthini]|uniref:Non-homologous end-joining DNA ligase n=1 Tax=Ornithinimicrobium cryptoxanthini TaxID=2934161 RepID=A0ABY4YH96_9MICO|nr:non-homologous end-joining DNA ligase [Ornithinimicrobium cryptoxanthini]USQ76049.1 non-homologous end-joining DNA ligase [Ornithinimicrobium cryptoxanthini]